MKKTFEFFLVLIIFYGMYSIFDGAARYLFENPKGILVILISLIFSALILFIYRLVVSSDVKNKMTKDIDNLKIEIKQKDEEVKKAQTFKEDLIAEAENSERME